jgi:hypothetical protein
LRGALFLGQEGQGVPDAHKGIGLLLDRPCALDREGRRKLANPDGGSDRAGSDDSHENLE